MRVRFPFRAINACLNTNEGKVVNRILLLVGALCWSQLMVSDGFAGRNTESLNATWTGTVYPEKGKKPLRRYSAAFEPEKIRTAVPKPDDTGGEKSDSRSCPCPRWKCLGFGKTATASVSSGVGSMCATVFGR